MTDWIQRFITNPSEDPLLYTEGDIITEESQPVRGEEWIVRNITKLSRRYKYSNEICNMPLTNEQLDKILTGQMSKTVKENVDFSKSSPFERHYYIDDKTYSKCVNEDGLYLLYNDHISNDFIISGLVRYLLSLDGKRTPVVEYMQMKVTQKPDEFDKQSIKTVFVIKEGILNRLQDHYPLPEIKTDIFSILKIVNQFILDINESYVFVHGNLTKENLMVNSRSGIQLIDFSYASLMVNINQKDHLIISELPEMRSEGDCPILNVEKDDGYYWFTNEDQYLLALKRGYVGRLAMSGEGYFETIDIYTFIISLLSIHDYRQHFFSDPRGRRYWRELWINDEYSETARAELPSAGRLMIKQEPGGYMLEKSIVLEYLKNRPLKSSSRLSLQKLVQDLDFPGS